VKEELDRFSATVDRIQRELQEDDPEEFRRIEAEMKKELAEFSLRRGRN
jgi:hypothetical protein